MNNAEHEVPRFIRDEAYLRENFIQWLIFRSRQRWLTLAAPLVAGLGAWLIVDPGLTYLARLGAAFLIFVGLFELITPWLVYLRWRRGILKGRPALPDLRIQVIGDALHFGESEGTPVPLGRQVRVWRGCLWYLRDSPHQHIYLPDRWLQTPGMQSLLQKLEAKT